MHHRKTLVLGASTNPERYSYLAVKKLLKYEFPVCAIGLREGEIDGVKIEKPGTDFDQIHTVTMYVGPKNQLDYYDYIIRLQPKRVIFNPGTQNVEFEKKLRDAGIHVTHACTLIMLSNQLY
ncbi:MAG: CoA-binding protein [Bacteroidetes bacterium]|nr:CoA-binding protein [Bacteroidota bacterium]